MAQNTIDGQLDIFAVIDAADREERAGDLPIHFTADPTLTPDDLETAFQVWIDRHGRMGCLPDSHMWHRASVGPYGNSGPHPAYALTADLRCKHYWREPCLCPGDLVDRIYCADCQWWTGIYTKASTAAVEYLDHCWTGWRDLPVLAESKPEKPIKIPKDYPEEWNIPGAPILIDGGPDRHAAVWGRSPLGGYDVSLPAID